MANGLSLRDKAILDGAARGKTAEEISQELQVPAARVVQELDRLTKTVDWLDEAQRWKLLTHNLWQLMGKLKDLAESGADALITKGYLDTIRLAFEQVEKQRELAQLDLDKVNEAQAKVLMDIVERAFYATLGQLSERYPNVENSEIEAAFKDNLVMVAADFDSKNDE